MWREEQVIDRPRRPNRDLAYGARNPYRKPLEGRYVAGRYPDLIEDEFLYGSHDKRLRKYWL